MEEYKTDRAVYTPNDFLLWQDNQMLEITPKFQRRPVWKTPARSFFIDTLLRGMTVPSLYFRLTQNNNKTKPVREVVDGQQRVRCVLEFIANKYRLSKSKKRTAPWGGKHFRDLSEDQQQQIMNYPFPAEIFRSISDKQILEVFCRLNMNAIALNKQELRNGRFFGEFKDVSFDLALTYLEFWRKHKLFTEQAIARMLEVELTSELLIAGNVGMQDKKKTIDTYYEKWEESYEDRDRDYKRFMDVMSVVSEAFPDGDLSETEFRRPPLFYSLYCAIFHHMFGLPGVVHSTPKRRLGQSEIDGVREAVGILSDKIVKSKDPNIEIQRKYVPFVTACQRQTDNITPRKTRFSSIFGEAF